MPNPLDRYYGAVYLHFTTTGCYQRRPRLAPGRLSTYFYKLRYFSDPGRLRHHCAFVTKAEIFRHPSTIKRTPKVFEIYFLSYRRNK